MTGVEAAALSAVICGTLKIVSNKLAPLLIKEYSSIVGVKEDLQELHDLAEEINFWLETTAGNSIGSRQSFSWLKKLKDISYDVDDVIDEFQLKSEKHDSDVGIMSTHLCTIPKSFVFQCKAANKINAIKKRFAAIVKQRTDYLAIMNSLPMDLSIRHTNMRTTEVLSLSNVDEELVVGRDKDKQKIISMLEENDDQQKIKIVSIIGLGGSGKTTLAKLVFNDGNIIEKNFEVRLWVHVSQEFDVKDLIKKLFEAFSDNNPGPHALPYMTKIISDKLIGKRFLLVLDDVWTNSRDEWEEFMVYIKGASPKSRILLTTRNREVAVIVGSIDQFHLPFLSPDVSWQLFQQSLVTTPTGWSFEFEEVGKAIVDKCGGVPLAIKVLAGALHGKDRIEEWQAMRDKTNVNIQEDSVTACLRLSYSHLPTNLKQCFTLCSVFPKGHKIDREQLIDLWIAHDIISLEDGVECLDLEYVGLKYFDSLLQVSFLQNVEEKYGRVTCGMHDLVHDLALSILGDEISLDMTNEATGTTKSYRYFSLIKRPENMVPKNIFRKTRAVFMHWYGDHIYGMALKHARQLRSVRVGFIDAKEANTISQVKYLKYLAMSLQNCEALPESISDIWSLQALHITHSSSLVKLPKSIGKLKKLRTLNLSGCLYLKRLPESIGDCEMISNIDLCSIKLTTLPNSIGKLQKLSTLNLSRCGGLYCLPDAIGDCQMISSIDLSNCWGLTVLPNSIGKLHKLGTINLSWCRGLKCLPDSIGDCQMISSIDLSNCLGLTVLPKSIGKLQKLRALNLSKCEGLKFLPYSIGDCQMISSVDLSNCLGLTVLPKSIGKLQKLRILNLSRCKGLKCLPGSIGDCQMISRIDLCGCMRLTGLPNSIGKNEILRVLTLSGTKVQRLPSSITKLRNLECLDLEGCELVELPEGIGNLGKLQVLNLKHCGKLEGMPVGFGWLSRLQKLGLFVVGKGEKFVGISELANVSGICEELTIKGISHILDPNDAHMACLKQKTNLQKLDLNWTLNGAEEMSTTLNHIQNGPEEVNTELEQDMLDGMEPPSGIKELEIHMYSGRHCARWMQNQVSGGVQDPAPFPFLRVIRLYDFPNLKNLRGLVELPCLEELEIYRMPSLESITGGPFPSLLKLTMWSLPCLGEVWMVAKRTMLDGEEGGGCCNFTPQLGKVRVGSCLTDLKISGCPKLEVKPHLPPSLQQWQLWGCEQLLQSPCQCLGSSSSPSYSHMKELELRGVTGSGSGHGWELLQHFTALESLQIIGFSGVQNELPESLWSLTSLRSLKVSQCSNICVVPESLGELQCLQELTIYSCPSLSSLPPTMGQLTSLQELEIAWCHALQQLPNCLGELCSLRKLEIKYMRGLTCLPQSMGHLTSLQLLVIASCIELQQLPDCLGELCSLRKLNITYLQQLTCLPQSIGRLTTSLQELRINHCPGIKSLPAGIKGLTNLKQLSIESCPDLERRCERGKGEDWHLISHIPQVWIFGF